MKDKLQKFVGEFKSINNWKLLYRASVDGFQSLNFHHKCDNIPNTITIIRSANGYVFGGFTTQTWDNCGTWKEDKNSFIFSLINADNNAQKFLIKPANCGNAIYCNSSNGPTFGGGCDFYICNSANSKNSSKSNFGFSYNYSGGNPKGYLAGSYNFMINEMEVFAITF